jgi:hypothetical protein
MDIHSADLEPRFRAPYAACRTGRIGVTAMRVINVGRPQAVALWIGVILLLCAFAPEAVAGALQTTTPGLCGAAAALGLALIREVNGDPK